MRKLTAILAAYAPPAALALAAALWAYLFARAVEAPDSEPRTQLRETVTFYADPALVCGYCGEVHPIDVALDPVSTCRCAEVV